MAESRFKLIVQYDGAEFCGWQKQMPPDAEPHRTVQGVLEEAVGRALRQPVPVAGASRTDSGVHAEGQVAVFSADTSIPLDRIVSAINKHLPPDVAVIEASLVPPGFDPISDAVSKGYRYWIHNALLRPVFDRHRVWHCWYDLDIDRMNAAARELVGEHDFESFANTHHGRETTVRSIHACAVARAGERVTIEVSGNGFLYHMVRIIAGTLVEVGRGQMEPGDIPRILEARDRTAAGPTLPPEGLCLMWVKYRDGSGAMT